MKLKIWHSSPHIGNSEKQFVKEAFDTNWIAPLGPNVNGFENDLQQYTGAKYAAALSSGTSAIHLALIMLDVKPGRCGHLSEHDFFGIGQSHCLPGCNTGLCR